MNNPLMKDEAYTTGGLQLLSAFLANQYSMRVLFNGDQTYTDLTTVPITIVLPSHLKNTVTNKILVEAKIDREAGRARYSKYVKDMLEYAQMLETIRIERLMMERYPGSARHFQAFIDYAKAQYTMEYDPRYLYENVENMINFNMRSQILNQSLQDYADCAILAVRQIVPEDIIYQILVLSSEAVMASNTDIVCKKAEEILDLLKDYLLKNQQPVMRSQTVSPQSDSQNNPEGSESSGSPEASDQTGSDDNASSGQSPENKDGQQNRNASSSQQGKQGELSDSGVSELSESPDESRSGSKSAMSESSDSDMEDKTESKTHQAKRSKSDDSDCSSFDWLDQVERNPNHQNDEELLNAAFERGLHVPDAIEELPRQLSKRSRIDVVTARRTTNRLRSKIEGLLTARDCVNEYNVQSGVVIDRTKLHTLCLPNPRPFIRYDEGEAISDSIFVLVDSSGSMKGVRNIVANESAYALIDCIQNIQGVECACGFLTGEHVILAKSFEERANDEFFGVEANAGTPMDMALNWAFTHIWPRNKERKIIIFFTDGVVKGNVRKRIEKITKKGIEVFGIGIGSKLSDILDESNHEKINKIDELPPALFKVLRKALKL